MSTEYNAGHAHNFSVTTFWITWPFHPKLNCKLQYVKITLCNFSVTDIIILNYILGSHHSLLFWNLETGRTLHRVCGHTHDIRALAFVPGGEFLLSGSRDKTLKLWNLRSGRFVEEFHFERFVRAIACASNGMVCVGLQGGEVCFLRFSSLSSHSTQLEQ